MPDNLDIVNRTFSSTRSNDVKDTKMLKGEAQNSLSGSNTTKPDSRSASIGGTLGGGCGTDMSKSKRC